KRPHALAVVCPHGRDRQGRVSYTHNTFRQLDTESDRLAHGLTRLGIGRGVRTVLMVRPGLDSFALTFALFKAGALPGLVDPGLGTRQLGVSLGEAEPAVFIGIPMAQVAARLLGWARRSIRTRITVGPRCWFGLTLESVRRAGEGCGTFPTVDPDASETA